MLRPFGLLILAVVSLAQSEAPPSAPDGPWRQYATAENAGFDPAALEKARQLAIRSGTAAVVVVHRGHVVAAWGTPDRPFKTASIRKSIVDLMFGAPDVAKSIRLDATLIDLGIDDLEPLSARERTATVAHLLSARSGVYHPAAREPASMTRNRPHRGSAAPGESWFYNNWDFNVLGTIYEKFTGRDVFAGFQRSLADPLGFEDYRAAHGFPIRELSRSRHAAYEFKLSARDLARVGHLVAGDGVWNGKRLVSSEWLRTSFEPHTPFPQGGGYGYLWWIDAARFRAANSPTPALDGVHDVAATGLGEQLLLVVPSQQLVIAHLTDRDSSTPTVDGSAFEVADLIVQARRGPPRSNAALIAFSATPLGPPPAPNPERTAVPRSRPAAEYVGEYDVAPKIRATIRHIDDGLFVDMPGRGEAEMFEEAPDRFFLRVADVVLTFARDAAGRVVSARVNDRGREMLATRVK